MKYLKAAMDAPEPLLCEMAPEAEFARMLARNARHRQ